MLLKRGFEDVKVIEYGNLISAPYCSKLFADLGAETLKIESPGQGDIARRKAPFLKDIPGNERSGLFLYLNTNKRGITLNLEKTAGREIFKKLIKDADILIEDTSPGTLGALALGYSDLKTINPALVMTSITAFGQTGPYRGYKGTDLTSWHMSGIGITTPRHAGTEEQEPLRVAQTADYITGMTAAVATQCALYVQRRTGLGQHVDISSLEALVRMSAWSLVYWPYEHRSPTRADGTSVAPYHFIKCKDGWFFAACSQEHHWERFVEMLGNPEWAKEALFEDGYLRGELWESLKSLIEDSTMNYTKAEIFEMAKAHKLPLAPFHSVGEVVEHKQLKEREFFVTAEHPVTGKLTYPGVPYKSTAATWSIRRPAPMLGQHNGDIYGRQLGYTESELAEMYEAGVI